MRASPTLLIVLIALAACLALAGCGAAPANSSLPSSPATAPPSSAAPSSSAVADPWSEDLGQLDATVRASHPDPFAIHPESAWTARLAEIRTTLPTATPDEQLVQLASLIGLLDTHSWVGPPGPLHAYEAVFYPFSDGWFVIRAMDPALVGARLVSIGGVPVAEVEARLRPLVPSDNESGELDALEGPMSYVEYLHGAGIVSDPGHPAFGLEQPDGSTLTVDLPAITEDTWIEELGIVGDLMGRVGHAPEAVVRRTEPVWTRLDKKAGTFLISYNDYVAPDLPVAIAALTQALDGGSADRVVLDMRYLRGGNGGLAGPLIDALTLDPRVNGPGGLAVLIGRENVSAGTVVAAALDRGTEAIFVGEPTPARADNFLCDCHEIVLANSGFRVEVPTFTFATGDQRDSIAPDVLMSLASADFFAGRDPVLEAVLEDRLP
jgi:hypothetical protein